MPLIPESNIDSSAPKAAADELIEATEPLPKNAPAHLSMLEPVEFVMASTSSLNTSLVSDKYEPINVLPVVNGSSTTETKQEPEQSKSKSEAPPSKAAEPASDVIIPLDNFQLQMSWGGEIRKIFVGLINLGNSCFMNSILQILANTPPLVHLLMKKHISDTCVMNKDNGFCFACQFRKLCIKLLTARRAIAPEEIFSNIRHIAPSFRNGRQEDAHEFLRFSIDALQLSAQNGLQNIPEKQAETSWVHRLFGGQFRSRVTCDECHHNSDTFDTMLDLSVDINRCDTLSTALDKFSSVERLQGKNKYNCERCKKPVNASKQLTVHRAPQALCIQLKRFTPWGRKMTHPVRYTDGLTLDAVMSQDQISPHYRLYGIVVHAGGGPNSGHYYSIVKNPQGTWNRVNDDEVSTAVSTPPYEHRNAYMLFYLRDSSPVNDAIAQATRVGHQHPRLKRKRNVVESEDEDLGEAVLADNKSALGRPSPEEGSPSKKPRLSQNGHAVLSSPRPIGPDKDRIKSIRVKKASTLDLEQLGASSAGERSPIENPVVIGPRLMPTSLPVSREPSPVLVTSKPVLEEEIAAAKIPAQLSTTPLVDLDDASSSGTPRPKRSTPPWMTEDNDQTRPKGKDKVYQSNSKKLRRNKAPFDTLRRDKNPYGTMGLSSEQKRSPSHPVGFGARRGRKPGL